MTEDAQIAIIGGTGALGTGLALRLARAGVPIVIGSRSGAKAAEHAKWIAAETGAPVAGADNVEAAKAGGMVIVAVPFASQTTTLREIAPHVKDKIVVDTTVPLVPPKVARVTLPPEGSAAQIAVQVLGPEVKVLTGFHNVSARKLQSGDAVECDVLVFGDDVEARDRVVQLVGRMGLRGLHGGPLANSAAAEALTSVLIAINKRYNVADGAGIRITGLDGHESGSR